jgi:hypothetical protein
MNFMTGKFFSRILIFKVYPVREADSSFLVSTAITVFSSYYSHQNSANRSVCVVETENTRYKEGIQSLPWGGGSLMFFNILNLLLYLFIQSF